MKRGSICFTAVMVLVSVGLWAQQPGHYSMFMLNRLNWNPAFAGMENSLSATALYRSQWVSLEGSPKSFYIDGHLPLNFANSGLGINLESDNLGVRSNIRANLAYNYRLNLNNKGVLAIGLGVGIYQSTFDGSRLRTPDGIYEDGTTNTHQDPYLSITRESGLAPTFQAGIYYRSEWMEAGLGVRNLTEQEVQIDESLSIKLARTYFVNLEFDIPVGRNWAIIPAAFVRSDLVQTQTDINLRVMYNDNIFLGGSLRGYNSNSLDAVAIMAGMRVTDKWMLAYCYDLTVSGLNDVSNGSHEVGINFNLNKPIGQGRPPKIIFNPRSL